MESTPKLRRNYSLTFGSRNKNTRITNVAQRSVNHLAVSNVSSEISPGRSTPNVDCDFTPPSKKLNLDDSLDFSPKSFDSSFSSNEVLSQSVLIDSPEVGWRWTHSKESSESVVDRSSNNTPPVIRRQYNARRLEQRRFKEREMRRAENSRANEMLIKRCARLQEQLKDTKVVTSPGENDQKSETVIVASRSQVENVSPRDNTVAAQTRTSISSNKQKSPTVRSISTEDTLPMTDTLDDFFNDTITDDLLVEATQHMESKAVVLKQPTEDITKPATLNICSAPATTTPVSKEKQSSFYMKFLEDDFPDDWFLSLDEVIQNATQAKKPRSPFQRYKSMPTAPMAVQKPTRARVVQHSSNLSGNSNAKRPTMDADSNKMKRHASSNTLSPVSSNYRGRQLHMRK